MRTVTRGGQALEVEETPWDFWPSYENGSWEPQTFEVLDRFLTPGATYVDVGAWVGPFVMYAAPRCHFVLAVEPDPFAFKALRANVARNAFTNVETLPVAVSSGLGTARLYAHEGWGDSMSSLTVPSEDSVLVPAVPLALLLSRLDDVVLVKMDIEGGECLALPPAMDVLEARAIPCLVSLHEKWWSEGTDTWAALNRFRRLEVLGEAPAGFDMVLGEW